MFQKISYFNLFFAMVYLFVFLKDGTLNSTTGILMIIVFNWLGIRSYQYESYEWKFLHYLTGLWSLYYAGYVLFGAFHVAMAAIEFNYVSTDTQRFLILSFVFGFSVVVQWGLYLYKMLKNK